MKPRLLTLGLLIYCCSLQAEIEYSGSAGIEQRYFLQDALYMQQERAYSSLFLSPEFFNEISGNDTLVFKPFLRIDEHDSERTHADIRELMWTRYGDSWEVKAGIGKVFWGQTESLHLVDIINQTDAVESIDGEIKLGQAMLNYAYFSNAGALSFYVLPYFRERTFQGAEGRFRPPIPISNAEYESSEENQHVDYAIRWQSSLGNWELGVSYFDGTSREPELLNKLNSIGNIEIVPYYAQIEQVGIDALSVYGAWLLKLEAIYRQGQSDDFSALVAGFEYTQPDVLGTGYELGLLLEYQFDERKNNFFAVGQNDVMFGVRLNLNDLDGTQILVGMVQDLDEASTYSGFIEASSRISSQWRWKLDSYFFSSDDEQDTYFFLRRDDHLQFTLEYFF